jgi:diguanylate cyclase (GGDEF)-like protein
MYKFGYRDFRASKTAAVRLWQALALAVSSMIGLSPAYANCLPSTDPQIHQLQAMVAEDATKALKETETQLDALQRAAHPDMHRMASLYAIEAESYNILEVDDAAREAAQKGLKIATSPTDHVHLDLMTAYAESVYDEAGIASAISSIEAARNLQPRGSIADTCLLITRGLLQFRLDRADLAVVGLMQAYRASMAPSMTEQRVAAAEMLSLVMRGMGDYEQALALNQEVIDWDTAHGATLSISTARFMRGQILKQMGQYSAAIDQFTQARNLSVQVDDKQGIAFADLRTCESQIELGKLTRARRVCENALRAFTAIHSTHDAKETEVLLARIDMGEGRADKALARLNAALDHNGADMPPRNVAPVFEWRARANAALRNFQAAYMDLDEYLTRYEAENDAERTRQAGTLRARFETDRQVEQNASLQRELVTSQEQSKRQEQQLRWNAIVVVSGVVVIALLIYFLVANLRFRQQLVKLASQDSLTGLPNRRRTAELAIAALTSASHTQTPLTIAIIDMDHFKTINDRCGHAAGDHVLQAFAKVSRETLRATDILGRWGGEEFLLVMPAATLDLAIATLERLRTKVLAIPLPPSGVGMQVSLSAGLATYEHDVKSLDDLIARADAALYQAKNQGRDLVRIADEDYQNASSGIRRALR